MKNNSGAWVGIGIFLLVGIAMLFMGISDYTGLKKAKEASTLQASDIKDGLMIKGKADLVLDYYCYETSDGNETYRWYLIPAINDMTLKYIGVKVNAKLFDSYEEVYKSTADYMEGKADRLTKTISYQGKVCKVKGDVEKNLGVWAKKNGVTENQDEILLPYYIELKTTKSSITSIVIGAVSLVLAGLIFILSKARAKKDKQTEENVFANMKVNPGWMNNYVINNDELSATASGNAAAQETVNDTVEAVESTVVNAYDTAADAADDALKGAQDTVSEAVSAAEDKEEIVADKIDVL